MSDRSIARWLFVFLLALYLVTGGGHGYSVDGAFGYEMAKTVLLDPQHEYFHRFKTAFARWGALMPLLGQPLVLAGDALSHAAPERDSLLVHGHTLRVEEWPVVRSDSAPTPLPIPESLSAPVDSVAIVSFLANAAAVPQGATVAEVQVRTQEGSVTLPVRAGVDTAEWAYDRPDVAGRVAHARPEVVGHWIGQPRGNLYFTRLALPRAAVLSGWSVAPPAAATVPGVRDASWQVRAAAFVSADGVWHEANTGERFWSARQTRDFFTRLIYASLNALTTSGEAALVYLIGRQVGYTRGISLLGALGFGAATMAWPYAKLDFSEPASALFVLAALWCVLAVWGPAREGDLNGQRAASRRLIVLGLAASASLLLAVVGKYTAALAAGFVVVQWLLSSRVWRPGARRPALIFGAALLVPALVAGLAVGLLAFRLTGEKPIVLASGTGRLQEDWLALPFWTGFRGLVFSPGKSVFLYSPWLLLALPGAWWLVRRHGMGATIFVALPALTVALYSMKLVWHGGSWGPRYMLPIVPFMCVAALPAIARLRSTAWGRAALGTLFAASVLIQVAGIGKDPEQYPSMVREFVVPALPDMGSRLGGYDYWVARGGPGLDRALQDPTVGATGQRGLGYLWGLPTAQAVFEAPAPRRFDVSLYFVDWDRQQRRERVTVRDALGARTLNLDRDFGDGVWATWQVEVAPGAPLEVSLEQTGSDTAVISAIAFGAATVPRQEDAVLDERTRGTWRGVYGADGYVLFGFRSFNIDLTSLPSYLTRYELTHVGDKPDPRIHVEIAEQDLRDTPLLYSVPFSPLLGNAWLLTADLAHLVLPARPDVTAAVLARPPWRLLGVEAPPPSHPEYGLGLDFWPTLLYSGYASHRGLLLSAFAALLVLEGVLVGAADRLLHMASGLTARQRLASLVALAVALLAYDWLQLQP